MTSRQWCEHFCKIVFKLGSQNPDEEVLKQLAKKLEPEATKIFKSDIEHDPDSDYDIFDADKASKADTVIDEAVARAFVAYLGFQVVDPNRVVEIFKLFSPKTDDDDDDHWHLDYVS